MKHTFIVSSLSLYKFMMEVESQNWNLIVRNGMIGVDDDGLRCIVTHTTEFTMYLEYEQWQQLTSILGKIDEQPLTITWEDDRQKLEFTVTI